MPSSTAPCEEYVTVLSVENADNEQKANARPDGNWSVDSENNFVTVLKVGDKISVESEVVSEVVKIYRLPGERLGMGLKFVGGVSVRECIERLFIQSIAQDSPAERTRGTFGSLREGDEIVEIEGDKVCEMTRLDCVSLLRDATVCISVLVSRVEESLADGDPECLKRKSRGPPPPVPPRKTSKLSTKEAKLNEKLTERLKEERRRLKPPPPVPGKVNGSIQAPNGSKAGPDDVDAVASPENDSQQTLETIVDHKEEDIAGRKFLPPEPTIYTDLFLEEECRIIDSESDDTGSSVSTVISRAPSSCASTTGSMYSEMTPSNSGPEYHPTMNMLPGGEQLMQDMAELCDQRENNLSSSSSFDLDLVLSPFEELERELAEDEHSLMLQHPKFIFHLENDVEDEVNDENLCEDVFKCLDEALDAVEEPPIEPPVKFKDEEPSPTDVEKEIICGVDGESGEFTCYRRSKTTPETTLEGEEHLTDSEIGEQSEAEVPTFEEQNPFDVLQEDDSCSDIPSLDRDGEMETGENNDPMEPIEEKTPPPVPPRRKSINKDVQRSGVKIEIASPEVSAEIECNLSGNVEMDESLAVSGGCAIIEKCNVSNEEESLKLLEERLEGLVSEDMGITEEVADGSHEDIVPNTEMRENSATEECEAAVSDLNEISDCANSDADEQGLKYVPGDPADIVNNPEVLNVPEAAAQQTMSRLQDNEQVEDEGMQEAVYDDAVDEDDEDEVDDEDDQILLILRDGVGNTETSVDENNIEGQMIPIEDTVIESCLEEVTDADDPHHQESSSDRVDSSPERFESGPRLDISGGRTVEQVWEHADSRGALVQRPSAVKDLLLLPSTQHTHQLHATTSDGVTTPENMNTTASPVFHKIGKIDENGCNTTEQGYYNYRQPPDGHEFPPIYKDICRMSDQTSNQSDLTPKKVNYAYITEFVTVDTEPGKTIKKAPAVPRKPKYLPPPLPKEPPPPANSVKKSTPSIVGCVTKTAMPSKCLESDDRKINLHSDNVLQRSREPFEARNEGKMRWKSEENLRNSSKVKEHKPVSVKERIAMFSSQSQENEGVSRPVKPVRQLEKMRKVHSLDCATPPVKHEIRKEVENVVNFRVKGTFADKSKSVENLTAIKTRRGSLCFEQPPSEIISQPDSSQKNSDVSKSMMKRRESFNGYTSNYPQSQLAGYRYNYPGTLGRGVSMPQSPLETSRVNNPIMANLLESRRFGASKLRGLIIPERNGTEIRNDRSIPTIFSCDSVLLPKVEENAPSYQEQSSVCKREIQMDMVDASAPCLLEPPWKSGNTQNIPKYSPAFKRRSLQLAPSSQASTPKSKFTPVTQIPSNSSNNDSLSKDSFQFSMAKSKPVEQITPEKPSPLNYVETDNFERRVKGVRSPNERKTASSKVTSLRKPAKSGFNTDASQIAHNVPNNDNLTKYNGINHSTTTGVAEPSFDEVKALNRLNSLLDERASESTTSEGVKEAVNGFIRGALKEDNLTERFRIDRISNDVHSSPFSSNKMQLEVGNDSCFEEEENLTSKSSSPAPSVQSDDTQSEMSSLGSVDHRQRFACRTNSSDSALKSMSSDQKSTYSATDDSWSDASSDSIDRPLDPDLKPRRLSQQRTVLKEQSNETDSVRNFKALAQTWQERAKSNSLKRVQSNENVLEKRSMPCHYTVINGYSNCVANNDQQNIHSDVESEIYQHSIKKDLPAFKLHDSLEESHSPKSWMKPSKSLDELHDVRQESYESKLKSHSNEMKLAYGNKIDDSIRNGMESICLSSTKDRNSDCLSTMPIHKRLSSIGSSISEGDYDYNYPSPITSPSDVYGSVSSLASTGSLISSQEVQQLLEEASHSLEESGTPDHQIFIVVLQKEAFKSSTGITLSGGSDYEQKEIIVHKIIKGSLADKDGRIKKGDRVLSINGRTLRNVTHRESLIMLKSPRSELTIVASRPRDAELVNSSSIGDLTADLDKSDNDCLMESPIMEIEIVKDGAGLGFSLEGGKDSPSGDRPLCVKRIFIGGAADKCGVLKLGDEILTVNDENMSQLTRIEAWQLMKRLPDGVIKLTIRQSC